jgi:aspartate kinase
MELDIPVRILNSKRPDVEGTLITASPPPRPAPLTALACTRDITVVDITSSRMLMAHGFLRRLFEVFERFRTPVDVVTTSEVSVSVTINDRHRLEPLMAAISEFAQVSSEPDMALVCAVGENLQSDPALFARVLGALEGVSLRMVSQAASRRNVTFVIRETDLATTMNRLHERFFG